MLVKLSPNLVLNMEMVESIHEDEDRPGHTKVTMMSDDIFYLNVPVESLVAALPFPEVRYECVDRNTNKELN